MIEIEGPDGSVIEFPEGTSHDQIKAAMRKKFGGPEAKHTADDGLSQVRTGLGGFIEGIPVAGPFIRRGTEMAAAATMAPFSDMTYSEIMDRIDETNAAEKEANPGIDLSSQLASAVGATALTAGTAAGPAILGTGGKTLTGRVLRSGASGLGLSAADQTARNLAKDGTVNAQDVAGSAAIGGAFGAASPIVGLGARWAGGKISDGITSVFNPVKRAGRQVGQAIDLDRMSPNATLTPDDVAAAARNGQPLINADMGGETTRALTRAAANQNPEARGAIAKTVSDRFENQSGRLVRKLTDLAGGKVDDLAAIDAIKEAADLSNTPAYQRAFNHPKAQAMFTPRLQELMQAPALRAAVKSVPERSANRGAVQGFKQIGNPFHQNSKGAYVLKRRADGSMEIPNLQFWNQVKKNLDGSIGAAKRSGDREMVSELMGIKRALVNELDTAVPAYRAAREGASSFFGAEDAVDAGRKFAKSSKMVPEFRRGIQKMTQPEREAFKVGFASELIDGARNARDRTNVISRYFGSPESRDKMVMAFGKPAAAEFEAFVRVENAMDMLRTAMGNSTTARQLIESGMTGAGLGGATWMFTGDINSGVMASLAGAGTRMAGRKINERVMKETAELLLSNDPKKIERAIKMAARSPQHMAAIDAMSKLVQGASRGAIVQMSTE